MERNVTQEILKITGELLYQIKRYEDYYEAWKALKSAMVAHNKAVVIARDFFSVTHEALLHAMMMEIIKLFDCQKDAMSVTKLLKKCSDPMYSHAFDAQPEKETSFRNAVKRFDGYMNRDKTKHILENLIYRRDKYYMHNDPGNNGAFELEKLINATPFSFFDAEEIAKEAKAFCEMLYELCADKPWEPLLWQDTFFVHNRDFTGLDTLLSAVEL